MNDTSADHIINYLDAGVTQLGCNGYTSCWIQEGYGIGDVSGHIATSLSPYAEENDNYGYDVNWSTFSLTQNDLYVIDFTGQMASIGSGNTVGLYEAWTIPTGANPVLVAGAWLQYYNHTNVQATTEAYTTASDACPTLSQYQYFGTDGSANNNSNTQLNVYNGSAWESWPTNDLYFEGPSYPYEYTSLSNAGAFETWKDNS